ncbi:sulfite exporter TauE/SafE family protein [Actinoplanes sp. NPDC051411]|uniref:sulfite exporter TauE/SafE family protein n=1 Tax=Actinoplanes sp. NPDC051411 TaxID=3155522 RepID=UPI003432BDC3
MILLVAVAVVAGLLIGAVGIGGVLLPPALIWLVGLDPHTAAGTASWCFLFTSLVGITAYAKRRALPWRLALLLTAGAAPAAAGGALTNGIAPEWVLHLALAALTLGTGVYNLLPRRPRADRESLPAVAAVLVGAGVGFGSALTGTGGAVLLVPVLLSLAVGPRTAVAASQLIGLPLVAFACAAFGGNGQIRYGLGTLLGIVSGAAVVAGAAMAGRLPQHRLRQAASATLVGVGILLFTSFF